MEKELSKIDLPETLADRYGYQQGTAQPLHQLPGETEM